MSVLEEVVKEALEKSPELRKMADLLDEEISQKVQSGELSEEDIPAAMSALAKRVEETMPDELRDILEFKTREGDEPVLNPLLRAEIAERAFFDGDVPEFRSKTLSQEAKPAVPVKTEALNPVLLGALLQKASGEVQAEILALSTPEVEGTLPAEVAPEPEGYRAGQIPALRETTAEYPLTLQTQERRDLAWVAVSTTQGRRSTQRVLQSKLEDWLSEQGVEVSSDTPTIRPSFSYEWTLSIADRNVQDGFSPAMLALEVFKARIRKHLKEHPCEACLLEVSTVDDLANRVVGWQVDLHERSQDG